MVEVTIEPEITLRAAAVAGDARKHIAIIKEKLGLSHKEIAKLFGVARSQVYAWENGQLPDTFNANRLYYKARRLSSSPKPPSS